MSAGRSLETTARRACVVIPKVMQERDSDGPQLTQPWVAVSLDQEGARDSFVDAGPYLSGLPVDTR
jgi:hypothetical protein